MTMNEFRVAVLGRPTMAVLSTEFDAVEWPFGSLAANGQSALDFAGMSADEPERSTP